MKRRTFNQLVALFLVGGRVLASGSALAKDQDRDRTQLQDRLQEDADQDRDRIREWDHLREDADWDRIRERDHVQAIEDSIHDRYMDRTRDRLEVPDMDRDRSRIHQ
jgi:hypothetical protein